MQLLRSRPDLYVETNTKASLEDKLRIFILNQNGKSQRDLQRTIPSIPKLQLEDIIEKFANL